MEPSGNVKGSSQQSSPSKRRRGDSSSPASSQPTTPRKSSRLGGSTSASGRTNNPVSSNASSPMKYPSSPVASSSPMHIPSSSSPARRRGRQPSSRTEERKLESHTDPAVSSSLHTLGSSSSGIGAHHDGERSSISDSHPLMPPTSDNPAYSDHLHPTLQQVPLPRSPFSRTPRSELRSTRRHVEIVTSHRSTATDSDVDRSTLSSSQHTQVATSSMPLSTGDSSTATTAAPHSTHMYSEPVLRAVIWGTNINIQETIDAFRRFLRHFRLPSSVDTRGLYMQKLETLSILEEYELHIDCQHLLQFAPTVPLFAQLVNYPEDVVPILDNTVTEEFFEHYGEGRDINDLSVSVRPYHLGNTLSMRHLDPADINRLMSVKGLVIRVTQIIPYMHEAFYRCVLCDSPVIVPIDRGVIDEPHKCPNCDHQRCMVLIHNRSKFHSKQIIRLQETPEATPEGQTPYTITLIVYDRLVDSVRPGDRVEITGIFRAVSHRPNPRTSQLLQVYRTFVDVLHIQRLDKTQSTQDITVAANEHPQDITMFDAALEAQLQTLAGSPDIYERLARSLAPSIYEMEDIKKGILLQLLGGTPKVFQKKGTGRFRSDINVLLVGDPGTSKSQMLQYVNKIAPRGIYTSGKGSSAVGLTAYVTRDPETHQLVLESGALVLSDGGICCIDEFDKMSDTTRAVLHEAMEQQTVSVAKAGIICSLNARTAILAAANPRDSHYSPNASLVENVQLPPTLLSRFDLIFVMIDRPDEYHDRKLARHLISLYYQPSSGDAEGVKTPSASLLDVETLTKYIAYARSRVQPKLTDGAVADLTRAYVDLRRRSQSRDRISATPRQLEALIRLAEAHARTRFSQWVEREDVTEAIRLMIVSQQQAAMDPTTGVIDMDIITTGRSTSARTRVDSVTKQLRQLLADRDRAQYRMHDLMHEYNTLYPQDKIQQTQVLVQALDELSRDGVVHMTGSVRDGSAVVRKA